MKIIELVKEYRAVLSWNGESASELYDHVVRITKSAPQLFVMPVPFILKKFYHRVTLRFDLSRLEGDILTIDKHGRAIIQTLSGLAIVQLARI